MSVPVAAFADWHHKHCIPPCNPTHCRVSYSVAQGEGEPERHYLVWERQVGENTWHLVDRSRDLERPEIRGKVSPVQGRAPPARAWWTEDRESWIPVPGGVRAGDGWDGGANAFRSEDAARAAVEEATRLRLKADWRRFEVLRTRREMAAVPGQLAALKHRRETLERKLTELEERCFACPPGRGCNYVPPEPPAPKSGMATHSEEVWRDEHGLCEHGCGACCIPVWEHRKAEA